jgi:hypothetical protein
MGLVSEIMNQSMLEEKTANKERYVGTIKYIAIHPTWFHELMDDPKSREYVVLDFSTGCHKIFGIPFFIDPKVEKWKITI